MKSRALVILVAEFQGTVSSKRMMLLLLFMKISGHAVVEMMEEGTVAWGLSCALNSGISANTEDDGLNSFKKCVRRSRMLS